MSATREALLSKIESLWDRARSLESLSESSSNAELLLVKKEIGKLISELSKMPSQDLKDPRVLRG